MPQTLWFPLREVAALLTEHPDTGAPVPQDLVLYIDGDIRLHSPAHDTETPAQLWPCCPHDVYPIGCVTRVDPAPYKAVTGGWALLPLDLDLPAGDSLAEGIRHGARAGTRWLAIAVHFDGQLQPVVTAHRNTVPAPGGQWRPGLVHTAGLPGPYPALVATAGRHGTAVTPAFTIETIARIATDTQWWDSDDPTAPVARLRCGQVLIAHPGADGTLRTHVVDPTSFGYLPLPGHWAWQLTDPANWPDPPRRGDQQQRRHHPVAGRRTPYLELTRYLIAQIEAVTWTWDRPSPRANAAKATPHRRSSAYISFTPSNSSKALDVERRKAWNELRHGGDPQATKQLSVSRSGEARSELETLFQRASEEPVSQ